MATRTVIKLGSSTVAEPTGHPRVDVIARIATAVAARRAAGEDVVVVSSGAIAHGMQVMGRTGRSSVIVPLAARPIGLRVAATMTASVMTCPLLSFEWSEPNQARAWLPG